MFAAVDDRSPWIRTVGEAGVVLIAPPACALLIGLLIYFVAPGIIPLVQAVPPVPAFPLGVGIALLLAFAHARRDDEHSRLLYWVWILPFGLLLLSHIWTGGIPQSVLLKDDFGYQTDDEGLTQLFIGTPAVCCLTYAVGRWALARCRRGIA
jgi:hypothetical protein